MTAFPPPWTTEPNSPAHDLARTRLMLTEADVDLIIWATLQLASVRDLNVYDLGAGSGTTAASVLSARPDRLHGTTIDIDQTNLDWSRQFITQTWPDCATMDDPFPIPCKFVHWNAPASMQWRWILSPSIPLLPWRIKNRSVHLLLIDTSHEYRETLRELYFWRPKMNPKHFVWLDDYTTYPGVKQAVDELSYSGLLQPVRQQGQGILCRYEQP